MRKQPRKRRPGEFELRVLPDGRIAMIAPDQALLDLAGELDPGNEALPPSKEKQKYARTRKKTTG